MYAAKIEAGQVVQVIVGDAGWARDRLGGVWEPSDRKLGVGWTFTVAEGFRPPRPFPSWEWVDDAWTAPKPYPDEDAPYTWDEDVQDWVPFDPEVV